MDPNESVPQIPPKQSSAKALLITILVLGLLGLSIAYGVLRNANQSGQEEETQQDERTVNKQFQAVAPNIIVYGTWRGADKSVIKAFDLQTGDKRVLARIKSAVKKITVISKDQLLYIDDTNDRDHGQELVTYSLANKKESIVYKSDQGFGIDDYVVSPDRRFVAVWEVRLAPDTGVLSGGSSRVYAAEIGKPKNRLYDEVQTGNTPVHYPRAIINSGEVYLDKFLPNNSAGWAYGMSVSNISGTQKQDLTNMQNGTYGTQPTLSPDGRYLAFAGYDGTQGTGTTIKEGFRLALLRSNTVELFDTQTKQRQKLANLPGNNTYSYVSWDKISGKLIYMTLSKTSGQTGIYAYDLTTQQGEKLNLGNPPGSDSSYTLASYLTNGNLLVGTLDTSDSSEGNLGDAYAAPYTSFAAITPTTVEEEGTPIKIRDSMIQLITVLPNTYFPQKGGKNSSVKGSSMEGGGEPEDIDTDCDAKSNQQLCPFYLKTSLASIREKQQSEPKRESPPSGLPVPPPQEQQPKCRDLATKQCGGYQSDCIGQTYLQQKLSNSCDDSPLYLYGTPGQKVSVKIGTHVFDAIPAYNNGYNITLVQGNKMQIGSNTYDRLEYSYTPGLRRISQPSYGTVTAKNNLAKTLTEYALRLGLNQKETEDLVVYGREKITAPFVFVSFFNHDTSHKILPLAFFPKPDNYRNIVFYFKQLSSKPAFVPQEPLFEPFINREGLTAVEVSSMVE